MNKRGLIDWTAYTKLGPQDIKAALFDEPDGSELVDGEELRAQIKEFYNNGYKRGYSTGWSNVDEWWTVRRGEFTVITGIPNHGKALALDTPILTASGWQTMGSVAVGDVLFDESGKACRITRATDVMLGRPCYRMKFSDGTEIVADAEHQWLTSDFKAKCSARNAKAKNRLPALRPKGTDQTSKRTFPSVKTTSSIAETLTAENGKRWNHSIAACGALEFPMADLLMNPYVLGAWLGDGTSSSASITSADPSGVLVTEQNSKGKGRAKLYRLGKAGYGKTRTQESLQAKLRVLGVLGNKHIPDAYKIADVSQRTLLLKGLMDTDGTVTRYGRCEFTSVNQRLAEDVLELVRGLGYVAVLITGRAMLRGRDCGPKFRITFTPNGGVFSLPRKKERLWSVTPKSRDRRIVGCERVDSVPVRCIEVDSPSHLFLCSRALIPTHNSSWTDNLMVNLSRREGWKWAVFSAENLPAARYVAGLMEIYAGQPFLQGPTERMSVESAAIAFEWVLAHFRLIQPREDRYSLDRIVQVAASQQIDGLVIDPWNEMDISRPKEVREDEFISASLTKLRWLARSSQIHVIVVAHPAKYQRVQGMPKPVITLNDVKGASEWYAKADNGISVWRDETDADNRTQVHIQKVRFREVGRAGGVVELYYDRATGIFDERQIVRI